MPLTLFANAQRMKLPSMNVPTTEAFLAEVHTSNDEAKLITCGFFRMEKGPSLV
jgi:hypothetical protein